MTATKLEVPDRAVQEFSRILRFSSELGGVGTVPAIRAVAAPVVAAYLRRLADETVAVGGPGPGDLRQYADELEAGQ